MFKYVLLTVCLVNFQVHADWLDKITEVILLQNKWDHSVIKKIVQEEIEDNIKHIAKVEVKLEDQEKTLGFLSKSALKTELYAANAQLKLHKRILDKLKIIKSDNKKQQQIMDTLKEIQANTLEIKELENGEGVLNRIKLEAKKAVLLVKRRHAKSLFEL